MFWPKFTCFVTILLILSLAGCGNNDDESDVLDTTGDLRLMLTDKPINGEEVISVMITISQVTVHQADDEPVEQGEEDAQEVEADEADETDDSWITVVAEPQTFNLIALTDISELLGEQAGLPVGKYTQIRLTVAAGNITILQEGQEQIWPLTLVGNSRLKLVQPFDIMEGQETVLLLNFDAEHSVQKKGKDSYSLKPVIRLAKQEQQPIGG